MFSSAGTLRIIRIFIFFTQVSSKRLVNMSTKVLENMLTVGLWTSHRIYTTRIPTLSATGAVY